jgi:hypothetical protein
VVLRARFMKRDHGSRPGFRTRGSVCSVRT